MSKSIVITGANSGVGLETARGLFADGHSIIFGARNQQRNLEAIQQIHNSNPQSKGSIKSFKLDLSKRNSIDQFAKNVQKQFDHIDILINNAGLILNQKQISELQIQMTMTINHFGHFYLTYLLFSLIKQSKESRIINVSSMVHFNSTPNITQDLKLSNESFGSMTQYYKSKLANVQFTSALASRLSNYSHIKTISLHPGIVQSNFGNQNWKIKCFQCICCCVYINNQQGARTSLHLSRCPFQNLRNGEYYHSDTNWRQMSQHARNKSNVEKLWKVSEKIYGIQFEI